MELANNISRFDERIQVLDPHLDVLSVVREITQDESQEDAFYICDVNDIIQRHENWKAIMPRIETHYAVKCNDSKIVLQILAALGTGFDCASKEEIRKLLSLGVGPDRIIFANPTKKPSHIRYAADAGVTTMTFDNENELYKIKKYCPNAKLLLRIKYDDVSAKYVLGGKYGCNHETESKELLSIAKSLDIDVVGVCFHIGSGCEVYSVYAKAIAAAKHVFDVAATMDYELSLLDIGGGFPGQKHLSINEVGQIINSALDKYFPDRRVKVIAEPGRYYVNTAFTLASIVHSMKTVTRESAYQKDIKMYYVDVSVYGALIPVIFNEYYSPKPLDIRPDARYYPSIIWGPTCDGYNKLTPDCVPFPEMQIGDWVVFEETGAYTLAIACDFSGFPTPHIHSVVDKENCKLLTEKVPFPLPKKAFVFGNSSENFKTGIINPHKFRSNYF